jgi:hypothetical protein
MTLAIRSGRKEGRDFDGDALAIIVARENLSGRLRRRQDKAWGVIKLCGLLISLSCDLTPAALTLAAFADVAKW